MSSLAADPSFSIVVPTYARAAQLDRCLLSLAEQDYPRDRFEVIVIDDGSPAPPNVIVDRYRERIDVTLLVQSRSGPAAARNAGASRARHEYLAFTDDDCAATAAWLSTLAARLRLTPEVMVAGRTMNALPKNYFSVASQALVSYLFDYYNADTSRARFMTSNNFAVRSGLFSEMGGFDPTYPKAAAEDRDLCARWLRADRRLVYEPDALVLHHHALTASGFVRQHFEYGRGAFRFHRSNTQGARRVEPLAFYLRLVAYPLSKSPGAQAVALIPLLAISQAVNAAGFFWERAKRHPDRR